VITYNDGGVNEVRHRHQVKSLATWTGNYKT